MKSESHCLLIRLQPYRTSVQSCDNGPKPICLKLHPTSLEHRCSQIAIEFPVEERTNQSPLPPPLRLFELLPAAEIHISARWLGPASHHVPMSVSLAICQAPSAETTPAPAAREGEAAFEVFLEKRVQESVLGSPAKQWRSHPSSRYHQSAQNCVRK